jgi:DNA/RNA endonuclease G (NUC1)
VGSAHPTFLTYNAGNKGPNWVSWLSNKSWLGNSPRPGSADVTPDYPYSDLNYPWLPDATLPSGTATSIPTNYSAFPGYDRGHLAPNADRNRNIKDQIATFLTTNLLPQEANTNQNQAWSRFEAFSRTLVKDRGWELYTIAGGFGALSDEQTDPLKVLYGINTPEWFWKVIVALKPGQGLADITANTPVIAVQFPNFPVSPNPDAPDEPDPRLWSTWTVRIKDIETATGLNLLSNLPDPIKHALEEKDRYTGSSDANFFPLPTSVFAPLLAGTDSGEANNLSSIGQYGIGENLSTL